MRSISSFLTIFYSSSAIDALLTARPTEGEIAAVPLRNQLWTSRCWNRRSEALTRTFVDDVIFSVALALHPDIEVDGEIEQEASVPGIFCVTTLHPPLCNSMQLLLGDSAGAVTRFCHTPNPA